MTYSHTIVKQKPAIMWVDGKCNCATRLYKVKRWFTAKGQTWKLPSCLYWSILSLANPECAASNKRMKENRYDGEIQNADPLW